MTTTATPTPTPEFHTRTHWSLVQRLKEGGNDPAWQEFYDAYRPLLLGLARKSGLSSEEAEEAVQETVMSVFKSLPQFQADPSAGSFKNWLFRLARWRILNQFEKRPRDALLRAAPGPKRANDESTGTPLIERIPDTRQNAMEVAWEAEWRDNALELALDRLKRLTKARHFQAFYLHVVKQRPAGDVARALGIPLAQVYLVKCRLLPKLKRIIRTLERQPL